MAIEQIVLEYISRGFEAVVSEQKKLAEAYGKADQAMGKFNKSVDQSLSKFGRLSQVGRDLRQAGGFLGNDTITALGDFADGLGDIGQSIQGILQRAGGLAGLGKLIGLGGLAVGGAFAVQQVDQLLGHPYEKQLGGLLRESNVAGGQARAQLAAAGVQLPDLSKLGQSAEDTAKAAKDAELALVDMNNRIYDMVRAIGKISDPKVAQAFGTVATGLDKILSGPLSAFGVKTPFGAVSTAAQRRVTTLQQEEAKRHQDSLEKIIREGRERVNRGLAESAAAQSRLNQEAIQNQIEHQKRLTSIGQDANEQRVKLAMDYAGKVAQLEEDYYANRAKLVQNYDKETQRLEQDHQIQMRRLAKDHGTRLRKLAETRDALGIEDENESYKKERDRAEEDYQINMQRRNEDYAQQLRELEDNFRKQRDQQQTAYNQQLTDLNDHLQKQYTLTREWYQALEDELKKKIATVQSTAATTAPGQYPGGLGHPGRATGGYARGLIQTGERGYEFVLSHATTKAAEAMAGGALSQQNVLGGSFTINQTFSGQESSPEVYRRIVYDTVTDLFQRARR